MAKSKLPALYQALDVRKKSVTGQINFTLSFSLAGRVLAKFQSSWDTRRGMKFKHTIRRSSTIGYICVLKLYV